MNNSKKPELAEAMKDRGVPRKFELPGDAGRLRSGQVEMLDLMKTIDMDSSPATPWNGNIDWRPGMDLT